MERTHGQAACECVVIDKAQLIKDVNASHSISLGLYQTHNSEFEVMFFLTPIIASLNSMCYHEEKSNSTVLRGLHAVLNQWQWQMVKCVSTTNLWTAGHYMQINIYMALLETFAQFSRQKLVTFLVLHPEIHGSIRVVLRLLVLHVIK